MTRLAVLTALATCVSVAAFAATEAMMVQKPDVIEIEVAPGELAECERRLQQVSEMPAVTDSGTPILFNAQSDLPGVTCVARAA